MMGFAPYVFGKCNEILLMNQDCEERVFCIEWTAFIFIIYNTKFLWFHKLCSAKPSAIHSFVNKMLYELNSVNHMICIYLFQTGSRILSISGSVQYVIFKHSKPTAWIRVCGNAVSILRWHYISGLKCWTGIEEYAQWGILSGPRCVHDNYDLTEAQYH